MAIYRKKRNYTGFALRDVPLSDRIVDFLFFRPVVELKNRVLFRSLSEVARYILKIEGRKINFDNINSKISLLSFYLSRRPLKSLEKILEFKDSLFKASFLKAQIKCGVSNTKDCEKCPFRISFETHFNNSFKAVYPQLRQKIAP